MRKEYFLKQLGERQPSYVQYYNYDLVPDNFPIDEKIPIKCKTHGVFLQKPYTHWCGHGCFHCGQLKSANGRRYTTEEFLERSKSLFGNQFTYEKTTYLGQDEPLTLTCATHGDFETTARRHLVSTHGCSKCDYEMPRREKFRKIVEAAHAVHGHRYDYSRIDFKNVNEKVEIVCPEHGSFWQDLYSHVAKSTSCPKCNWSKMRSSQDYYITKAKSTHGDKYDYSKTVYSKTEHDVTITCKKHGDFTQRAGSHLLGNGCKKCFQENTLLPLNEFIKKAREVHGDTYDYSKVVYCGNKKVVEIGCSKHGSFWQRPNSHISSRMGCRLCSESKGEKAVEVFLKKYGIEHIREYRIPTHLYRFDFYLPGLDIYIEFNGHQHYWPVEIFGGQKEFSELQKRDAIKAKLVKETGGNLIVLTYQNLDDRVVEKILVQRLKRLYARWYLIDGHVVVFKTPMDVCVQLGISPHVRISDLDMEVKKKVNNAQVLF